MKNMELFSDMPKIFQKQFSDMPKKFQSQFGVCCQNKKSVWCNENQIINQITRRRA